MLKVPYGGKPQVAWAVDSGDSNGLRVIEGMVRGQYMTTVTILVGPSGGKGLGCLAKNVSPGETNKRRHNTDDGEPSEEG